MLLSFLIVNGFCNHYFDNHGLLKNWPCDIKNIKNQVTFIRHQNKQQLTETINYKQNFENLPCHSALPSKMAIIFFLMATRRLPSYSYIETINFHNKKWKDFNLSFHLHFLIDAVNSVFLCLVFAAISCFWISFKSFLVFLLNVQSLDKLNGTSIVSVANLTVSPPRYINRV